MRNRAAFVAVLAAVLAVPAPGFAGTPCDLLRTTKKMVIKSLAQGQSGVVVSWQPRPANNYANPIDYSSVQTITLPQGRWKIAPDATFPSDFSYTISFRA